MPTNKKCVPSKKEGWKLVLLLIILFAILYILQSFMVEISNIKSNWPKYKCNPMFTIISPLFGYSPEQTFTECIADQQSASMEEYLAPLNYQAEMSNDIQANLANQAGQSQSAFEKLSSSASSGLGGLTSIFFNMLINFQKIFIKLKHIIQKVISSSMVITYLIKTQVLVGQSFIKGPVMSILSTVCFHPDTLIKMKNGKYKSMKNINLGDILENNSKVTAVMKIQGNEYSPYYKIYSEKLEKYIFVTGEHLIQDDETLQFIPISKHKKAIKTDQCDKILSCLVTDDHLIPIGEYIFWDWED